MTPELTPDQIEAERVAYGEWFRERNINYWDIQRAHIWLARAAIALAREADLREEIERVRKALDQSCFYFELEGDRIQTPRNAVGGWSSRGAHEDEFPELAAYLRDRQPAPSTEERGGLEG